MATIADDSSINSPNSNHNPVIPLPRKLLPNPPRPPVAQKRKSIPKPSKAPSTLPPGVDKTSSDAKINEEDANKNCEDDATQLSEKSDTLVTCNCESLPNEGGNINSDETTQPALPPEPPYASIKKSSVRKKSLSRNSLDNELDADKDDNLKDTKTVCQETSVELTPPPIPKSRPPPEDYKEMLQPQCEDSTVEQENVKTIASDDDDCSKEPPYEQIDFNTAPSADEDNPAPTPPVVKRTKQPPPKPKMRPPPRPPPENNPSVTNELKPPSKSSNIVPVTRRENKGSASKSINIIKRKSLNFTKKSIQIFKHHNTDDNKDNANASSETTKNHSSKSAPPSKAKSFSFPHRKDGTTSQSDDTATAAKSTNLSRHQSTPGRTDKPKRVPPPRPAMPTVLQNRLLSPVSPPGQKEHPLSSNKTDISSTPVFSPNEEKHIGTQDEIFHYPEPTQLDDHNNSLEKPSQLEMSPTKSGELSNVSENLSSPSTNQQGAEANILPASSVKTASKPARPPPMKKGSNKTKTDQEDKEKKESFFDVIKSTDNENKAKVQVDEQMKHYITDESYYVATQDYQSVNFTDLSFTTGEKILVLKRIDDDLLFGRNEDGEEGPFPEKYVRLE